MVYVWAVYLGVAVALLLLLLLAQANSDDGPDDDGWPFLPAWLGASLLSVFWPVLLLTALTEIITDWVVDHF